MSAQAAALFSDRHAARAAVEQLVQAGFSRNSISIAMSEDTHEREFRTVTADDSAEKTSRPTGVLATIVATLVAVTGPGGPALRVGGPLVAAVLRAGGLLPGLGRAGFNAPEAQAVADGLSKGSIVLGVQAADDRARLAAQLLELSGGNSLQAA